APGKISLRHGGFLSNLEQFDPQFFGISPREAASMDPQQRLFLEVAWEALEHANCAPDRLLNSKTGVFAGVTMSDYLHLAQQVPPEKIDAYFLTGNCLNVVPGRVSFFLGVHGPSLAVDTACSSSLTAIHLACQSLRRDECEIALAGGVNVMLMPEILISASRAHMFARDGRCKTFDAAADGFVRGEGCGVVVLKRLSAAQKNGDRIFAIIRGTAINQDGPSSGLTVPNSEAQKELIRAALRDARVAPHQIQYVEAHGTGTSLGDPIEVRSLGEVLSTGRTPEQPLFLGSVKTNLGHLESAAGVAGLIKVALALHHGEIPPHLHFQKLNPDISLDAMHGRIPTQLLPWPAWGETRLAGVSAFGMSGTNVHVIMEGAAVANDQSSEISHKSSVESEQLSVVRDSAHDSSLNTDHRTLITDTRTAHLLTLSAKEENALRQMAANYERHLVAHEEQALAEVCYSANVGRAKFSQRLALVANSSTQARARLNDFVEGREAVGVIAGATSGKKPKLAFLYAGQGYQYLNMGRVLYQTQPTFRRALKQCDELFRPYLKTSLLDVLYPETSNGQRVSRIEDRELKIDPRSTILDPQSSTFDTRSSNLLDQTFYTQPAMFSLQYALTQLWLSWGVTPAVVMGHSLGEFMAAQLAGVYSLEDAVKLVAERGRLTEDVPAVGMMASVQASAETVTQALADYHGNICIAAINGPDSVVITGIKADVNDLLARFEREGVNVRRLAISNAFHSPFIEPALDNFSRVAAEVRYHQPKLPLISTLTGQLLRFDLQSHDPQSSNNNPQTYWRNHLREPVQFFAAMRTLHEMGVDSFLEIGPNPTQLGMGRRCLPEGYGYWFPSLRQGRDDWQQMLESVGAMFVAGCEIDWRGFEQDYARRFVSLPTYPFQRKRYWIEDSGSKIVDGRSSMVDRKRQSTIHDQRSTLKHPLLQHCTRSPLIKETIFETQLSTALFPYFEDHKVHGMVVLPLTGHLEVILAAARIAFGESVLGLDEIVMHEPLLVPENEARAIQLAFKPEDNGAASFQLISLIKKATNNAGEHKVHVTGKVAMTISENAAPQRDLQKLQALCTEEISVADYYRQLWERGLHFGPQFHGIQKLFRREGEALGQIALREELHAEANAYHLHPALLDACLQVLGAALPSPTQEDHSATFLPINVESFRFYKRPPAQLWSNVALRVDEKKNVETYAGDVAVYDAEGALVAELRGLLVKRTGAEALQSVLQESIAGWLYEIAWRPQPLSNKTMPQPLLGAPAQLAEAAQALLPSLRAEADLAAYEELLPKLDRLCSAYVVQALRRLGWNFSLHQRFQSEALARQLGVIDKQQRLFGCMLAMLADDGVLALSEGGGIVARVPEEENLESQYHALLQNYPASATELELTHKCGQHLAQVLRGEYDPLQLLFPGGSVEVLEKLYQHSPVTRAMNRLVARAVSEALADLPKDRKLRVLEIGAGTGGTTAFVLPHLAADRTEYVFTDVSPLFLQQAQDKFREHACVRYQMLDIERDPLSQKFEAHSFDIVIAANVLHATADLRSTMQHVKQLLGPKSLLVLLEGTEHERWVDLTFGLTEGWWKFSDTNLRPDYALLSKSDWSKFLAELQFSETQVLPGQNDKASCGRALAQHAMILARGPHVAAHENLTTAGSWLIFADANGLGAKLRDLLHEQGQASVLVSAGESYAVLEGKHFSINPKRAEDFHRLVQEVQGASNCAGVAYLWALDEHVRDDSSLRELQHMQDKCGAAVLHLVQALVKSHGGETPRLWLVTQNAQLIGTQAEPVEVAQSSLWGLGKIISLEHPELHCVRVDVQSHDDSVAQALFDEMRAHDREDLVAYREGERYVARLVRVPSQAADRGSRLVDGRSQMEANVLPSTIHDPQATQLIIATTGVLDTLQYKPTERRAPKADEVEIHVHAVGMNFRDVLNALGMYPGDAGPLGSECSGTIVTVGEGVTNFKIGDEVMAIAAGSFSTFVTMHAELVTHKPEHLSFTEAATIPSAFITAYYTLIHLGKLQQGERVLIHSAAGGVGMAAVQLAQRAGAEIFATAGSAEKREFLRGFGVQHLFDSRSLDFAREIMRVTNNEGVDVILNSLSGEFIPVSLSILKDSGRFLEIGKRGIWARAQIDAFKRIGESHVVDLAAAAQENPTLIKTLLHEVGQGIEDGSLKPLPLRVFSAAEIVEAFRCMQGAKHIGKIVVEFVSEDSRTKLEESGSMRVARGASSSSHDHRPSILDSLFSLHEPQSTLLITGGLAGLGLLTAQWLVEQGVRYLALMARSAPSAVAGAAIAEMEKRGAKILIAQGDVSREADVKRVLYEIKQSLPPLRGIIHSAGVLDDGALLQQKWERFETVLAPKVNGAWLLHQLTLDEPLNLFVLYSSMASMLGMRGQGNHAMANAFLDGLAQHRRNRGQAGTSIHWGAWSEVGAAAERKVDTRVRVQGVGAIAPQKGLQALSRILQQNLVEVGVLPINWAKYVQQFDGACAPFFSEMVASAPVKAENKPVVSSKAQPKILEQLQNAPQHLRKNLLLAYVKDQALRVLGLDSAQPLDKEQPLQKMGLDSLMAVELRNVLGTGLGLKRALPATLLFDYPTITAVTEYLAKDVLALESVTETQNGKMQSVLVEKEQKNLKQAELAQLSDEEAEALLLEELSRK
ncbi:SDR family NAD(P)-dependent oxidoreductase, partial [candidate division KSB1 bacterium]|nr:SDR family NAD(P)-dependent oxidoreductase [candidate division KSB1 bacterium]